MKRETLLVPLVGLVAACGGGGGSTDLECGTGTEGVLAPGGTVAVTEGAGRDLVGAAVRAQAATTPPAAVTIECAADIVPPGFVALGPAVTFGPVEAWSDRPFELTLPFKAARLPEGAARRHVRIVATRAKGDTSPFFPPVSNRVVDDADVYASRVTFRAGELTTYQAVAAADAGQPVTERFSYRALVGISMGGNAAMSIALSHPDTFDTFANLGGEPGASIRYLLATVRDYLFGGFCTVADQAAGNGNLGELCLAQQRDAFADQFESRSDFEHMLYQEGDGVGLTLQRSLYMKGVRDMARALGNPTLYNPADPYAPPGIDPSFFATDPIVRCANPVVLDDFFDREFNPAGTSDVITFCDGNDSEAGLGYGVFDPAIAADDPVEIALAVDLDGNGRRDSGEPVIANAFEPYADVGTDGTADAQEPGYDAATNADPAGDNWHYQRNPRGTEGNFDRDAGEPYEDVGLDGVAATCQAGDTPPPGVAGCYDFGEGDGAWTLSPNIARWYAADLATGLAALTPDQRRHMNMWFDGGIRDFLNTSVAANAAAGTTAGTYALPLDVYDGFEILTASPNESSYFFADIDWSSYQKHVYVRYGNPDASAADIARGDGRHVGTAVQVVNRVTTAFAWVDKHWPNGDRDNENNGGTLIDDLTFTSPGTGRVSPFGLFLPPGYDNPANATRRYPVIYFLHGYGQQPADLVQLSAVFEIYMQPSGLPRDDRFQKFIIVYVDGRCRPTRDGVPVDPSGDRCERGTFYRDAVLGGPAQMETNLLELIDHIDATYRTRAAEDVTYVP
jgi:S-formylglutathione hydrolase FrmB